MAVERSRARQGIGECPEVVFEVERLNPVGLVIRPGDPLAEADHRKAAVGVHAGDAEGRHVLEVAGVVADDQHIAAAVDQRCKVLVDRLIHDRSPLALALRPGVVFGGEDDRHDLELVAQELGEAGEPVVVLEERFDQHLAAVCAAGGEALDRFPARVGSVRRAGSGSIIVPSVQSMFSWSIRTSCGRGAPAGAALMRPVRGPSEARSAGASTRASRRA